MTRGSSSAVKSTIKMALAPPAERILHTYTHNPYAPLVMREVTTLEMEDMMTVIPDMIASPPPSAATPHISLQPRLVYVNGRPIMTMAPGPLVLTPPLMAAGGTPRIAQDMSAQDISIEESDVPSEVAPGGLEESPRLLDEAAESDVAVSEEYPMEEEMAEEDVVTVQFHQHQAKYFCESLDLSLGDFVVTDGDRGYDIGYVVAQEPRATSAEAHAELKGIRRFATPEEIRQCQTEQVALEDHALSVIREAARSLRLPMHVKSCEFQYDRMKLSFYFEAKTRVDFVTLLKILHHEFGCRIWLQQINRSQMNHPPTGKRSKKARAAAAEAKPQSTLAKEDHADPHVGCY